MLLSTPHLREEILSLDLNLLELYPVNSNRYTDEDSLAASSATTDFQSDQCDEENEEGSPRAIISTATEEPNKESDKTSLRQWLRSGDENIDVLDSNRPITIGNDDPSTSAISNASSQIDGEENTSKIAENRPTEETETTTSNDSITHHSQNSHDTPSTKKIAKSNWRKLSASQVSQMVVSPKELMPLPKRKKVASAKCKAGSSKVITATPEKTEIERRLKKSKKSLFKPKQEKDKKLEKKQKKTWLKKRDPKKKNYKPKNTTPASSSSDEVMSKDLAKNFEVNTSDEFSEDYDDFLQEHANTCDFCGDLFSNSKPGEQWVRCRCKSCKFCNKHDVPAA